MQQTQNALFDSLRQLGSGRRIDRASDDPAGLGIAKRLQALEAAIHTGVRNLNDGVSTARVAEGGLQGIGDNLQRLRELAVQGQNGTLSDADRATLQQEFDQVVAEIDRVSEATSFNDQALLDGTLAGSGILTVSVGSEGGAESSLEIGDHGAAGLGVAGLSVGDPGTIQALDGAIDRVASTRATVGSFSNRVESQVRSLTQAEESTAAARSRIEDLDLAEATSRLARDRIVEQGNIFTLIGQRRLADAALTLL